MKGIIFTVSVFLIFSLILEIAMLISLVNTSSNKIITSTVLSEKITGYSRNLISNLEKVANTELSADSAGSVSVKTSFHDYNATGSLKIFEKWVNNFFNNQTNIDVKTNLSGMREAINQGSLLILFEPQEITWENVYSSNKITGFALHGADKINSLELNASFNWSIVNSTWVGNQPGQGDFLFSINLPDHNASWLLDKKNYYLSIGTSEGYLNVQLRLDSGESDKVIEVTPDFYGAEFLTTFKVNQSNVFKASYPYNKTWVNLSANNFGLSVLNNGELT
ncbi:MAG: hypothetical protein GOU97_04500 [Nanoarchaeota archaeon]|nr:hypothetical protein [Nanoarchaeota archaeon]